MGRARAALRLGFLIGRGLTFIVVGVVRDEIAWRRSRSALDAEPGMAAWFATVLSELADFGTADRSLDLAEFPEPLLRGRPVDAG